MRTLPLIALSALAAVDRARASSGAAWVTPHDSYSSSIGVLGCKINTNRVAYWPGSVDCSNFCVRLSYADRSVKLLRIDQSGGAHDVSYDAWNYLYTGYGAKEKPTAGGAVAMNYEELAPEECKDLILTDDKKMPFSAANSMNFIASCLSQSGSWIGSNYGLYNIIDSVCSMGFDEKCKLDLAVSNQPNCSHMLGLQDKLTTDPVYNIRYPTGEVVVAGTGQVVTNTTTTTPGTGQVVPKKKGGLSAGAKAGIGIGVTFGVLALLAGVGFWWWKRRQAIVAQKAKEMEDGLKREDSTTSLEEISIHVGDKGLEKGLDYGSDRLGKETRW